MIAALVAAAIVAATPVEMTAPGPTGPLAGTLLDPGDATPAVLVIPGSGPTDRDGNNPLGVTAAPYRLLAEALAKRGVATLRVDKRGMFGSRAAVADANAVTIADYAADARAWIASLRARTGRRCVWLLGHSEGGLVALAAAQPIGGQAPEGVCGVILLASPGRPMAAMLREQFAAAPGFATVRPQASAMLDAFARGRRVEPATLPSPLATMFPAAVQGFVIDLLAQAPAAEAARLTVPLLIVQGRADLQVSVKDAEALAAAAPKARLVLLPGVNHVLKRVGDDPAANAAAYRDASIPVAEGVVDVVAAFVKAVATPPVIRSR